MANKEDAFTLWNNPMEQWTKILEGVTVTQEMLQEAAQTAEPVDSQDLEDRIKPFKTTISENTLSQLVD